MAMHRPATPGREKVSGAEDGYDGQISRKRDGVREVDME
jgi:hypothetical protein